MRIKLRRNEYILKLRPVLYIYLKPADNPFIYIV